MSTKDTPPPLLPLGARVGLNTDHAIAFFEKLQSLCLEFKLAIEGTEDLGVALVPLDVDSDHPGGVYAFFSVAEDGAIEWCPAHADSEHPADDSFVVDVRS